MSRLVVDDLAPVPLREAIGTWIRVALLSFGGPAGQIAVMHRLVVEERCWVPESRFLHAMSYCMLLPGPEAQQLATYLGWLLHGRLGGLVAGILFIIPGLVSLYALSVVYVELGDTTVVAGLFYGLKPAVIAVVVSALLRIGRRALGDGRRRAIAAAAFVLIFFFGVSFPLIVALAALVGFVWLPVPTVEHAAPTRWPPLTATLTTAVTWLLLWFVPIAALAAAPSGGGVFLDEALFFSKTAVVTFGGAYAVLSYIAEQAVNVHGWLAPGEMLDGLGMAETTPGPLIQVVQFVGFLGAYRQPAPFTPLMAATLGSLVTAWVTFLPCFLFVLVGAPYAEHLRGRRGMQAALAGITAAVVGVVLNLAVWFSLHTLFARTETLDVGPMEVLVPDPGSLGAPALVLAAAALVAMLRFRVGMIPTLALAAACGLAWRMIV